MPEENDCADLVDWVKRDPVKCRAMMDAEKLVQYGVIQLTYRDSRFIHLDAMPRIRAPDQSEKRQ